MEEKTIEIKTENSENYVYVEQIKEEENASMEFVEVKQEELIIKNEPLDNYDNLAEESYEDDNCEDNLSSNFRPDKKLHVCSVCSKSFTHSTHLKNHIR